MKQLSFFKVIRILLSIRLQKLKWRLAPEVLVSIARGLILGFGISAMHLLFDSVENTLRDPSVGWSLIVQAVLILASVIVSEQFLTQADNYLRETNDLLMRGEILSRINRKAAGIDPIAYENTSHLENIEKANEGAEYSAYLSRSFIELFAFFLPFLAYVGWYLYSLRPLLLLAMLFVFAPTIVCQIIRSRIISKLENQSAPIRRQFEHYEAAMCRREFLKETRQLGAFNFFFGRYLKSLKLLNTAIWKAEGTSKKIEIVMQIITIAGYGGVLLLLMFSLRDGIITIGAFAAVFAAIERIFDVVNGMILWGFFSDVSENLAYSRNVVAFYNLPERDGDDSPVHICDIELKNVSFSYPGREDNAVTDISLKIGKNETIAIVGENGAGKSTLVKLITGIYLPTTGQALINGNDMRTFSMRGLFANISGIFQRYQKYKMTVRENIVISQGHPVAATDDDTPVFEKATVAGVEIESGSYPDGMDTILSREFDGVDLSGGQWQRVAIARGLYRNHQLIVLDEPTAAIDPIEETAVYNKFVEFTKNMTGILVTHRLGSAKIADRIIVMDAGRIVEEGSHESLIGQDGKYAEMYHAQSKWYS